MGRGSHLVGEGVVEHAGWQTSSLVSLVFSHWANRKQASRVQAGWASCCGTGAGVQWEGALSAGGWSTGVCLEGHIVRRTTGDETGGRQRVSRGNEDASVGRKPGGPEVCTGRAVQGL